MSSWKVFIDDSADAQKKQYVIAGALLGRKDEWHSFTKKWRKVLHTAPRIEYFHQKEFSYSNGEFLQFRNQDMWPQPLGRQTALAKRDALRDVIRQSKLVAVGIGVLVPDYEKVRETHPRGKVFMAKDVFEWALQNVISQAVAAIKKVDRTALIAFISDNSNKAPRYSEVFGNWKQRNPQSAELMLNITHIDDEKCPGLQAADMIASTTKKAFDNQFSTGQVDFNAPLLSEFWRIGIVNEDYLITVLDNQSLTDAEIRSFGQR